MPKLTNLLSDIQIKNWVKKGDAIAKSDGDGLTFTLSKGGTASWVLRYRIGAGKRRELTLGNYPDMTLSAAREEARKHRVTVDKGGDPAVQKQEVKTRSRTQWLVQDLVADFRAKRLTTPPLDPKTIVYRNYDLNDVILPKLGRRKVQDITPADIVDVIDKANRTWAISKRILTCTRQLFDHACGTKVIQVNPCVGISLTAIKGERPPVRKRVMLSEEELRTLLPNAEDIGIENALAFKILLATCVRTVELVKARKEDVDFERATWWVPDESVKTRSGFLVPLVPVVMEWFRELFDLAGDSEWVLPARTERRRRRVGETHVCNTTLWAAIKRAFDRGDIEIRRFTPHDTRSTAKGHMRNMGVSREISEIALNHTLKGMEGIYDVREEIPERRQALEKWAAFIVACEQGLPAPTNVVPLRAAAA